MKSRPHKNWKWIPNNKYELYNELQTETRKQLAHTWTKQIKHKFKWHVLPILLFYSSLLTSSSNENRCFKTGRNLAEWFVCKRLCQFPEWKASGEKNDFHWKELNKISVLAKLCQRMLILFFEIWGEKNFWLMKTFVTYPKGGKRV